MRRRSPSKTNKSRSKRVLALLSAYESRNVTFIEPDGTWPIVWERAQGVSVWDAEGKKYLDLTAAFGVAAAGHANPRVVRAGQRQMGRLLHAMGDVHPHALKAELARELSRLTFERWTRTPSPTRTAQSGPSPSSEGTPGKTIFCSSGFEAVEAALKTAILATGRREIITFEGAYHGLGYGALNATYRSHFRAPFLPQLREFGQAVPFPTEELLETESRLRRLFQHKTIGAVLVEPIQVRGGINIPPPGFLSLLRRLCDDYHALLILDEIYTGFGRTGKWFACEHAGAIPDIICLGKALTGGFPLSACVGRADLMDRAWPASKGEAIHTSTFLGHPVGCAMALQQIKEIERPALVRRSAELGKVLMEMLSPLMDPGAPLKLHARGLGLLAGIELRQLDGRPATETALCIIKSMLHRGFILLPEGEFSNVISFTPPLTISRAQLSAAVRALRQTLEPE